jgi:hypothetical protein
MDHRAALFLDFDNVFTALIERDVAAAAAFVQDPLRWITWLETLGGEDRQRRILVRRCYLNPIAKVLVPGEDRPRYLSSFRNAFVRAGFQMVDCPPLTQGGKTSADMVMVMDILDTLAHPTGFEEFIILSSDADFTPVLLRLRAHDRRGIVIAAGSAANAYRAAADTVIGYDEFALGALGLPAPVPAPPREAILAEIRAILAASAEPLRPAYVAQAVIRRLGRAVVESDWAGAGGFQALVEAARAPDLAIAEGWLFDPARHAIPRLEPRLHQMAALVKRLLSQLGNIPVLNPERLGFALDQLVARLPIADPSATELRHGIAEAARAEGQEVAPGAVNAIMHRAGLAGFDWAAPPDAGSARRLREAFLANIRHQLAQQGLTLGEEEAGLLAEWAGLAVEAAAPEPEPEPAADFGPQAEAEAAPAPAEAPAAWGVAAEG